MVIRIDDGRKCAVEKYTVHHIILTILENCCQQSRCYQSTGFHVYNCYKNLDAFICKLPLMSDDQEEGEGGMSLCRFLTPLSALPSLKAVLYSGFEPYARSNYRRVRSIMVSHEGKEGMDG